MPKQYETNKRAAFENLFEVLAIMAIFNIAFQCLVALHYKANRHNQTVSSTDFYCN